MVKEQKVIAEVEDYVAAMKLAHSNTAPQKASKDLDNKVSMNLLDFQALTAMAEVLVFGKRKYAAHNWRKGLPVTTSIDAALRHLLKTCSGEKIDPESGLDHLAHAAVNLMFALNAIRTNPALDDRYVAPDSKTV